MAKQARSGSRCRRFEEKWSRALLGLGVAGLLTWGAAPAPARQLASLPGAESIFDAFIEKSGGRALFEGISNRRTTSTMELSVLPGPAEVTTLLTKEGLFRVVVESQTIGKVEYGSDGLTVWEINPVSGPKILEGKERKRLQTLYGLDLPMRWRTVFKKVECTGLTDLEGRPAYKVMAETADEYELTYYFDRETGLLAKIELPMETPVGLGIQEVILREYRTVTGRLFPYLQIRREFGRKMTLAFKSVEYNVAIPENAFALPEAIRKIVKSSR